MAKGRTPEQAQALGVGAFEALFAELTPKGKEKEAILQEIAINNQLIADGVVYLDRLGSKQIPANPAKSQVANLKLNNLELQLKLQPIGYELFAQAPTLPSRKSEPKRRSVLIIAVLASGFALLLWVFLRQACNQAAKDPDSAEKMKRIKAAFVRPAV